MDASDATEGGAGDARTVGGAYGASGAALPADWGRRPPPGWVLVGGWTRPRWTDLPRAMRLRLWHLAALPAAQGGRKAGLNGRRTAGAGRRDCGTATRYGGTAGGGTAGRRAGRDGC